MGAREKNIARSISYTITNSNEDGKPIRRRGFLRYIFGVFNLYWLSFRLVREDLFRALRGFWQIPEAEYRASFGGPSSSSSSSSSSSNGLQALGDMGYSGSTFFRTGDGAYLVKSVPRPFEHNFFKRDLVLPYAEHVRANPGSLLIRITDFLECRQRSLGTLLGLAPSHHMVMENLLYGQDREVVADTGADGNPGPPRRRHPKWESWDLKPMSYFYPERDVAGGALASEATKSKLADEFPDKLHLTLDQAEEFRAQLQKDTRLLADANAVDYSLFLVRVSGAGDLVGGDAGADAPDPLVASRPPLAPPSPPSWRAGMVASHGGEVYRAAILDFFWAKHTVHAKAMTGLISTYNLIDEQGPMSVTADSNEYRDRFLKMCLDIVEVEGGRPWPVETGSGDSS